MTLTLTFLLNDINWAEVFDSAIVGDVFLKYDIKPKNQFMATIKDKHFVNFFSAMTLSNLERYMVNSGCNLEEYYEALKIWQS